jgi:hypothetical protein
LSVAKKTGITGFIKTPKKTFIAFYKISADILDTRFKKRLQEFEKKLQIPAKKGREEFLC